jgi:8-oxo-dGTP diphosphatase
MQPKVGVGALIADRGRLLLVERGHAPEAETWAVPGGRLRFGETLAAGAAREVAEETGLTVTIGPLLFVAEIVTTHHHFVILDYGAEIVGGHARPGSDARRIVWADAAEVRRLPLTSGMAECLADGRVREYLGWG